MALFRRDAFSYQAGDTLGGRYRVVAMLGRGGFGAVYSGEHLGTGQSIALKMLTPPSSDGEIEDQHNARFMREARITAQLQHPNTVRVFDVGEAEDGPLYLVMEHLRGPTLEAILLRLEERGRAMSEAAAIAIATPILGSLAEAHGKGLVHRDLKPANIMLSDVSGNEPTVKVLDFGCSRTMGSDLTGDGTILGTPGYMSPEQCNGDELDGRADVYSLGVILFRALCGRLPFLGPEPLTLMYQHAHAPLPDPIQLTDGRVSEGFAHVLTRALAKAPEDRFGSANDMRVALEALRQKVNDHARHLQGVTQISGSPRAGQSGVLTGLLATAWQGRRAQSNGVDSDIERRLIDAATMPYQRLRPAAESEAVAPATNAAPALTSSTTGNRNSTVFFGASTSGDSADPTLAAPTIEHRVPSWMIALLAGLLLLVAVGVGIWLGGSNRTPTTLPAPVAIVAPAVRAPATPTAAVMPAATPTAAVAATASAGDAPDAGSPADDAGVAAVAPNAAVARAPQSPAATAAPEPTSATDLAPTPDSKAPKVRTTPTLRNGPRTTQHGTRPSGPGRAGTAESDRTPRSRLPAAIYDE